jgi:hypothetical protein
MLGDATTYGGTSARAVIDRINIRRALEGMPLLEPPDDSEQTTDLLLAYVNHGRWVIDCPCGSAQLASREDPRFWCVECRNSWALGKWVGVEWPNQAEDIEGLLLMRPSPKTQIWNPDESVLSLAMENADQGVGA